MATGDDALAVLKDILEGVNESHNLLVDILEALQAGFRLEGASPAAKPSAGGSVSGIASDADLDGKWGNPEVKAKDPRDWTGPTQKGKRFSECPPEYLDMVASRLDYFAESTDDAQKAKYNRLDAARARGWAKRLRAGWQAPVSDAEAFGDDPTFGDSAF